MRVEVADGEGVGDCVGVMVGGGVNVGTGVGVGVRVGIGEMVGVGVITLSVGVGVITRSVGVGVITRGVGVGTTIGTPQTSISSIFQPEKTRMVSVGPIPHLIRTLPWVSAIDDNT